MKWFRREKDEDNDKNSGREKQQDKSGHTNNSNKNRNPRKNSKIKTKNSAVYMSSINIASSIAVGMQRSVKPNASKDIKKANRIISDMQLAKMQVRTGILGDKTLASSKRSDALNAYIVGTTSYNVSDSTITANQLAAKKIQKDNDRLLLLFTFISVAALILMNSGVVAILAGSLGVISYMIKSINRTSAIFIITALASLHIPLILLSGLVALVEELSLNKDTEMPRNLLYMVLACLI
jgi:hypothetical protein